MSKKDVQTLVGLAINHAHLAMFIAVYGRTDGERFYHGLPPDMSHWPRQRPVESWKPDYADALDNLTKAEALIADAAKALRKDSPMTPEDTPRMAERTDRQPDQSWLARIRAGLEAHDRGDLNPNADMFAWESVAYLLPFAALLRERDAQIAKLEEVVTAQAEEIQTKKGRIARQVDERTAADAQIASLTADAAYWKARWATEGDARAQGWTNWTPTPENVNALPDALRSYIHQLESVCDPSGDTQARILAEDTCRAQEVQIDTLRAERDAAQQENRTLDILLAQASQASMVNRRAYLEEHDKLTALCEALERIKRRAGSHVADNPNDGLIHEIEDIAVAALSSSPRPQEPQPPEPPKPTEPRKPVVNLMEALKKSLDSLNAKPSQEPGGHQP